MEKLFGSLNNSFDVDDGDMSGKFVSKTNIKQIQDQVDVIVHKYGNYNAYNRAI